MLRHFLNPPNWFTAASMFCGMYSIVLATGVEGEQNFYRAALMILFASAFDTIDGGVARLTKTGSEFGIQLDSLVDAVSFGLAPAILLYAWGIHSLGTIGLAGAFFFAVCGIFRLARFNLGATVEEKGSHVEGLTITTAGMMVAASVMAHAASGRTSVEHPLQVLLLTVVLSLLMVSTVPYRGLKSFRISGKGVIYFSLFLGSLFVVAVRFNLSMMFVAIGATYIAMGPLELLLGRSGKRLLLRSRRDGTVEAVDDSDDDDGII